MDEGAAAGVWHDLGAIVPFFLLIVPNRAKVAGTIKVLAIAHRRDVDQ